ncbi:nitrite reductase, copper-containing [Bradyrhizobium jicamae]|uniref:Copper-containing nitrite reductase n=2 Tax=Bradyrhizobium jicamae TaxID=280332 RepID=A0ABS5FXF3_9BRAD|nr:nitrite reductase, copper-containing [Bradyrhizobium jicamae]
MVLIFGAIYFVGRLSSSNNPTPAGASPSQAASSDQTPDRSKPVAPSVTKSPAQGGSGKQPAQQLAQSAKEPSQPAANPDNPKPAPAPSAAVAAPSPAAAPLQPAHDQMAMTPTPSPIANTDQSPAPPSSNVPPPAPNGPTASGGGDAAAGRLIFRKCQACHSIEPGKNLLGPSLAGVIGRKAGTEEGYNYSPAMKSTDIVWSAQTLDKYLNEPAKVVPGNKMPFPGLKTDQDRADVIAYLAGGGQRPAAAAQQPSPAAASGAPQPAQTQTAQGTPNIVYIPDARYTLRSGIADGRMAYIGEGGEIDGKVNPVLTAVEGQVVQLTLINGEGAEHDIVFPDQNTTSPRVTGKGASTTIAVRADKSGDFVYFCSVPGHRLSGMQGQFLVTPRATPQTVVEADISREPTDLPPPIGKRDPQTVRVDLLSVELEGRLAEGTTFGYWTFNGKVPGPMIRVRVGDTIDIHLKNSADSSMIHSVDFHAATGPGGGAAALQVDPGQELSMTWKALVPGLYVYHCATPMVAEHIANGMYGMILVEPEGGMTPVDREFYVMQGEIYSDIPHGQRGSAEFSVEKLLNERPEYFVFNGSVGALSQLHPLQAKVGETVRIYFGVGGPNYTSSFHVIGEIFDKVYPLGGLKTAPLEGIQTVSVAPGGAVIAEFKTEVPGNYTLVDHALARAERGLSGTLSVEGKPNPEIYNGKVMPGMGH